MSTNSEEQKDDAYDAQQEMPDADEFIYVMQPEKNRELVQENVRKIREYICHLEEKMVDFEYMVGILKQANIPADNPTGAVIKLLLDKIEQQTKITGYEREEKMMILSTVEKQVDVLLHIVTVLHVRTDELRKTVRKQEATIGKLKAAQEKREKKRQTQPTRPTQKQQKPTKRVTFADGLGEKITTIHSADIRENVVAMIRQLDPQDHIELGKIIKTYKPHIKPSTLELYVRSYMKYMNRSGSFPKRAFNKIGWAQRKEPPLTDEEPKKQIKKAAESTSKIPTKRVTFADGLGEHIDEVGGTDINANVVKMIKQEQPKDFHELAKIIKTYKPNIKASTLGTYTRGYSHYVGCGFSIPYDAFADVDWAQKREPVLSTEVPTKKTVHIEEVPAEEATDTWDEEIIKDQEAWEVVSVYKGKITDRRTGMFLHTILLNSNAASYDEMPELANMTKADVIRHGRYCKKKKYVSLRKGIYRVKEPGRAYEQEMKQKYDLDMPTPDYTSDQTVTPAPKKRTGKHRKRRIKNKIARKIEKKYTTTLDATRFEDILKILGSDGPSTEEHIIERLKEMEDWKLTRNNVYATLRYGGDHHDLQLNNKKYDLLPNGRKQLAKIEKREGKTTSSLSPSTEEKEVGDPREQAKQQAKRSYGITIDEGKYEKLKRTLDSAFGYKKSINEFAQTKTWKKTEVIAYLTFGSKIGDLVPVGKAPKPDGSTQYTLKENYDKLPRERKEIHIKSRGVIRDKENKDAEDAKDSKNYSIFRKGKKE